MKIFNDPSIDTSKILALKAGEDDSDNTPGDNSRAKESGGNTCAKKSGNGARLAKKSGGPKVIDLDAHREKSKQERGLRLRSKHCLKAHELEGLVLKARRLARTARGTRDTEKRKQFATQAIAVAEKAAKLAVHLKHVQQYVLQVAEALNLPGSLDQEFRGNSQGAIPYQLPTRIAAAV